ncbi:phosphate transport system substrate-binding protein [Methylopila capsulata]|uniref:Phosphate ABC transporter substrate-binding protein n=2 Tax=Methylopila capsulata TaxID=61654 RepID=A0A9W6MQU4_9HYPH|nr:PstS family phosphate ABC transporter substrate-binding protein [Methylopila capsulata]MBM7851980.1 phosphate transport system substrate-binding protein [Methylopila capsulata]GLK55045.1 phosphate ABC transporter substrate-binding protein [Methylopila capsulata]
MKLFTMTSALALAFAGVFGAAGAAQAQSRDQIRIVGSSTVYPFTTAAAEQFGKGGQFKTPVVESTGTGGGLKLFCAGVGAGHPDAANASRAIKKSEFDDCQKNGVTEIVELKVGFDGIVIANSKKGPDFKVTRQQLFLALAKEVPGPDGKPVANPYKTWSDIDPSLPAEKIEVLGPPPTSGTRDAFLELVMEKGAEKVASLAALKKADAKAFDRSWKTIREDGAYIDAGENDNLIVQKLEANPKAVGIFGYSFLEENGSQIKGATVEGQAPTFEAIADGTYKVSRPLYVYFKKQHVGVIPGLKEFIAEYASDKAMGEEGYLTEKGLVPLPKEMAATAEDAAKKLATIGAPAS